MRNHVFITFGLLMLGIFLWRGTETLAEPGISLAEAYVFGGFVLALVLIASGVRGLLAARNAGARPSGSEAGPGPDGD